MRKKSGSLIFCVALLCSGCALNGNKNEYDVSYWDEDVTQETPDSSLGGGQREPNSSGSMVQDALASTVQQEPDWAQATEIRGNLYQGLNLDGIGGADDEAYVSMYAFGDDGRRVLVLRVHLGTGETLAEVFPLFDYQFYDFQTGKLFSEDREAVILGVQNLSNYSATNLWVLEVFPAQAEDMPGSRMSVLLDTTAPPDGMTLSIYEDNDSGWGLFGNFNDGMIRTTRNPEVVDVEGLPLQGLKITIFDSSEGRRKEWENVIYWKDGIWEDENKAYIGKWEWLGEWTLRTE